MAWIKNNKRQGLKRLVMTSLLVAVICIDVMAGNAGDSTSCAVGRVEADFYVGACVPLGNYHDGDGKLSQLLGIDVRYNIPHTKWDAGVFLHIACAFRDYDNMGSNYQNNRTCGIGLSTAYNFRQGSRVNPFAEIKLGYAINDVVGRHRYDYGRKTGVFFSPVVGVELLSFLRVSGFADISRKGFHSAGLSLGIVVGGHKKNDKNEK